MVGEELRTGRDAEFMWTGRAAGPGIDADSSRKPFIVTLVLAFLFMLVTVAAMSVGVMMGRKPIAGSCGGAKALGLGTGCEICGGNPAACESARGEGEEGRGEGEEGRGEGKEGRGEGERGLGEGRGDSAGTGSLGAGNRGDSLSRIPEARRRAAALATDAADSDASRGTRTL